MLIVFILEMIYQKEQETIKLFSKISIQEITLAGFFLAIGIISDAFIRINNLVFLTFSIYILIGLIFRLFIGIIVAFLIDVFQLLLRGLLGFWFWSLQIEPVIIILITFMFKHLIFLFKDKKNFIYFVFLTLIIFISFSIFAFITNIDNFSFEKQVRKNKLETSQALISRLFVYYFSLIGFCFLIGLFIYQIYLFLNKKKNNEYMIIFTLILTISILIDWIYHPWAVQEWRRAVLNIEYNFLLYRATFLSGIFKSLFHIFLSILIVPITYNVYKFKFKSFSKKL